MPVGLMDYVADCEDEGNPTILAIKIATSFRNVEMGSGISLSMRWMPPYPPSKRISLVSRLWNVFSAQETPEPVSYSAANLPRFSLLGHLEKINVTPTSEMSEDQLATCFTKKHPDSKYRLPGNRIHDSEWTRIVVEKVYWIGGFGDRAYIGWIPVDDWRDVEREEWEDVRLPGEESGWEEWSFREGAEL